LDNALTQLATTWLTIVAWKDAGNLHAAIIEWFKEHLVGATTMGDLPQARNNALVSPTAGC